MGFVREEEELLEVFFPRSPRDVPKGTKTDISFNLMSGPSGWKFTSVLGVAGKCPEKVKQLKAQSYPPPSNPLFRKQKQVSAKKIIFA